VCLTNTNINNVPICGSGFSSSQKCCHAPVCGTTKCTITTTKANCVLPGSAATCFSQFYAGDYAYWQTDPNGQPMYYKAATYNGASLNYFLAIYFVPEVNSWTILPTAYINTANERGINPPYAYYENNAFCVQSISGSSWKLINLFTNQYETDSTMTISCS